MATVEETSGHSFKRINIQLLTNFSKNKLVYIFPFRLIYGRLKQLYYEKNKSPLALLAIIALFFASCQKENPLSSNGEGLNSGSLKNEFIQPEDYEPTDEEAMNLIRNFLTDVKDPQRASMNKNNGSRQFEIGMWMLEASLNAQYGEADKSFDRVVTKSTEFTFTAELQGANYYLQYTDLLAKYIDLSAECQDHHSKVLDSCISKHVIAVDLEVLTPVNPKTQIKEFKVKLTTINGLLESYHPICDWNPGVSFQPVPAFGQPNAADEIERTINRCYFKENCNFYTNIVGIYANGAYSTTSNWSDYIYQGGYSYPNLGTANYNFNRVQLVYFRDLYTSTSIPLFIPNGSKFIAIDIYGKVCQCSGTPYAGMPYHEWDLFTAKCRIGGPTL